MTTRALAMPAYVAELVRLPLARLGLDASSAEEDMITCPVSYENGSTLSVVILCVAKRGWFNREKTMLLVSFVELDASTRVVQTFSNELMAIPTGQSDLLFTVRLAAKIRATAWSLAATTGMGECLDLPGRPGS
jgi:hypothetical protein